ncbi:beta strand repeat-containing protein [Haloferula sargassicola]|uniref:beta strand repeat-containing protein n=1 Tax=Haloferula sargassicola TaxID=490096 RepID=UPI0033655243
MLSLQAAVWTGNTSSNWDLGSNWSTGAVPNADFAEIATTSPNIATVSSIITAKPNEIRVGVAGTTGRLDITAGSLGSNTGQNMLVGLGAGANGTLNLADTSGSGGTFTGLAQGSGSLSVAVQGPDAAGNLLVGDTGNGTVNVNTSGNLASTNDLFVGINGGTGVLNLDNGAVSAGAANNGVWTAFGRLGGNGTLNMSGGSLTSYGSLFIARDADSQGFGTMTGGNISIMDGEFVLGESAGVGVFTQSGGAVTTNSREMWIGNAANGEGTYTLQAGTLNVGNWLAIGRNGATGTLNVEGGTFTKTGNGNATIGTTTDGVGTINLSGGTIDLTTGSLFLSENGGGTGNCTISGGTMYIRTGDMDVGYAGSGTGNLTLSGGTLYANAIDGGDGEANVIFDGGTVVANGERTDFLNDFDSGTINAGGLILDSNGFALGTANIELGGTGGLTKNGAGSLNLVNVNNLITYAGPTTINEGSLSIPADNPFLLERTGDLTLADNTTLGLTTLYLGDQLAPDNATFGTTAGPTTLNLNFGVFGATDVLPDVPMIDVTGNLAVNGDVNINISGQNFKTGRLLLIQYDPANRSGTGSFVINSVPNGVAGDLVVKDNYDGSGLTAVYLNITSVSQPRWNGNDADPIISYGDLTNGSNTVVVDSAAGIAVGQTVVGEEASLPEGTTVTAVSGTTVTLSNAATMDLAFAELSFVPAGSNDGVWDFVTENWVEQSTGEPTVYTDPSPALFDDKAVGTTDVDLVAVVSPSEVLFNNSTRSYSLTSSGGGAIAGSVGITKSGTAALEISGISNTYTGPTRLQGGTTTVDVLTSGGVASPIGAASADPENLVLAGGTLYYTGPTTSIDRGISTEGTVAGGGLRIDNDLTLTNQLVSNGGNFVKSGPGALTATYDGANTFGGAGTGINIRNGSLIFDGTGGTQTNTVTNGVWIGSQPGLAGNLSLIDTSLSLTDFLAIGRGNGSGVTSTLTAVDSTLVTGAFSSGYANGLADNASTQVVTLTDSNWTSNGKILMAENLGSTSVVTVGGTSVVTKTADYISVGVNGTATLTVKDNASFTAGANDFNISDVNDSTGTLNIQDNGVVTSTGTFYVGKGGTSDGFLNLSGGNLNAGLATFANAENATALVTQTGGSAVMGGNDRVWFGQNGKATWNQSGGSTTCNGYLVIGRLAPSVAEWNVTGGTLIQNPPTPGGYPGFILAEAGTGTLTISGSGVVESNGQQVNVATGGGTGTLNLNAGGTLRTNRIIETDAGTSALNFGGGTLVANAGANVDFVSGIDTTTVNSGGLTLDSNGQTVAVNVAMLEGNGGGGLTKVGSGFLQLNGANTYTGTTTVSAGSLGGTGSVAGPLMVEATGTLAPGASAGTLTAGNTTIAGSYAYEIDGAIGDTLVVNGDLTLSGATLDITQLTAGTAGSYVVAQYSGALSGTFTVNGLPNGWSIDYGTGSNSQITLVNPNGGSPFGDWIAGYFGSETDPAIVGSTADPDGDGQSNLVEFALGGVPNDGSDNAKVYSIKADSDADGDATAELLMTIAVRSGTPAFAGSPSPTATQDGVVYTVQGSQDLATFGETVVPASAVTAGLPTVPAGYEYRTFSLSGSNGLPSRGFLRVMVAGE